MKILILFWSIYFLASTLKTDYTKESRFNGNFFVPIIVENTGIFSLSSWEIWL